MKISNGNLPSSPSIMKALKFRTRHGKLQVNVIRSNHINYSTRGKTQKGKDNEQ